VNSNLAFLQIVFDFKSEEKVIRPQKLGNDVFLDFLEAVPVFAKIIHAARRKLFCYTMVDYRPPKST